MEIQSISYIGDYSNKFSEGIKTFIEFPNNGFDRIPQREHLKLVTSMFYNGVAISHQEAVWRRARFPIPHDFAENVYVNTNPPKKRYRPQFFKTEMMDPIKRYQKRPDELENMCLAEFVANYTYKPKNTSGAPSGSKSSR